MTELQIDYDVKFEQHYADVLKFIQKMKHASCFELMKEFHIKYADSVRLMDTLEERDIVDVAGERGPRPLLTEAGKKAKHERQQREREEAKREAERPKPKPEPKPVVAVAALVAPVQPMRKRTRIRTKR